MQFFQQPAKIRTLKLVHVFYHSLGCVGKQMELCFSFRVFTRDCVYSARGDRVNKVRIIISTFACDRRDDDVVTQRGLF